MKEVIKTEEPSVEIVIPSDKIDYLQRELTNIREDFTDNKYVIEATKVLAAGFLRSTIGAYWNAVVDDLRRKIIHRSLDLFNKEIKPRREIKTYEDFQDHVSDIELIDGAFKIGVISWEAHKILQQARETRNIYYGHPDSSDPTLFKVFNMIADCNRFVLSQEYPPTIIDVNEYIITMDSDAYNKNEIAIEQAFTDLPDIYKSEMTNRLFSMYLVDNASVRLKGNIEFSFPILWKVISRDVRKQIGNRYDKLIVEGNREKIDNATSLLTMVNGLRYVSSPSRRILFDPAIKRLEDNLENWAIEGQAVNYLQRLGYNIPSEYIIRYVSALTLTYVGYKGNSYQYARTAFYSDTAAPRISEMFEFFDNASTEAFIDAIKTNSTLRSRIKNTQQLNRLRTLGEILLNKPEVRDDLKSFLEILVDKENTTDFFSLINLK